MNHSKKSAAELLVWKYNEQMWSDLPVKQFDGLFYLFQLLLLGRRSISTVYFNQVSVDGIRIKLTNLIGHGWNQRHHQHLQVLCWLKKSLKIFKLTVRSRIIGHNVEFRLTVIKIEESCLAKKNLIKEFGHKLKAIYDTFLFDWCTTANGLRSLGLTSTIRQAGQNTHAHTHCWLTRSE